jgi:hypothetical protein
MSKLRTTAFDKFIDRVEKTPSCWKWRGGKTVAGYGQFYLNGVSRYAHRWSFEHFNQVRLSSNEFVCHKCDNPPCVNPEHLFVGSCKNNFNDAISKGRIDITEQYSRVGSFQRTKTKCKHGHEFSTENTSFYGPENNYRRCKTCNREKTRKLRTLNKNSHLS